MAGFLAVLAERSSAPRPADHRCRCRGNERRGWRARPRGGREAHRLADRLRGGVDRVEIATGETRVSAAAMVLGEPRLLGERREGARADREPRRHSQAGREQLAEAGALSPNSEASDRRSSSSGRVYVVTCLAQDRHYAARPVDAELLAGLDLGGCPASAHDGGQTAPRGTRSPRGRRRRCP